LEPTWNGYLIDTGYNVKLGLIMWNKNGISSKTTWTYRVIE
jgi:hypothetical protein